MLDHKELELYIPQRNDGWFYKKMISDPETMAYNAPWFPPDGCIPDAEEAWEELASSWNIPGSGRFYAYLRRIADGRFVGDVNYHYDSERDRYDMGIVILASERGKGYGTEGLRLLLDKAFRVDGISGLHNDFETTRDAAFKIHKAVGFRETGMENGCVQLEITRKEYLSEADADPGGGEAPDPECRVERAADFSRVADIYETRLTKDFKRSERRPLSTIRRKWEQEEYEAFLLMRGGETLGYAFFVRNGNNYLFDYLAIAEGHRDEGLGTLFLRKLGDCFDDADCILSEVDDPDKAADAEERTLCEKRMQFYLRNGYLKTGVTARVFGVDYRLLEVPCGREHTDEEVRTVYTELYRSTFPPLIFQTQFSLTPS
jgi:RimJ/RimL family protein N-acetyltransferase